MKISNRKRFSALASIIAAGTVVCAFAVSPIKPSAESTLYKKLDFSSDGISSMAVHNAGNLTYDENGMKGNNALHLVSGGCRKNYVEISLDDFDSDTITIAGWFKISPSLPSYARLAELYKDSSNYTSIMPYAPNAYNGIHINTKINGKVVWGPENRDNMVFEGPDPDATVNTPKLDGTLPVYDTWVHYTYVYTPTGFYYYQNGKLLKSLDGDFSASHFTGEGAKLVLGATMCDGTADFTGSYSDIRIYKSALTEKEIKSEFGFDYNDFLTTVYDFENGVNESVRGYNGNLIGNAKTEKAYGSESNVLYLDGSNAGSTNSTKTSFEIPDKTIFGHNSITISMDAYIDVKTGSYSRIFEIAKVSSQTFILGTKWGGSMNYCLRYSLKNDVLNYETYTPIEFGKWHNVTVTLDGSVMCIYIDGVLSAKREDVIYSDKLLWDGGLITFGRTQIWGDQPLTGALDNIKIWQCALTESDILRELNITDIADDKEAVMQEKEKLSISWDGISSSIKLPSVLSEGVRVFWTSSDKSVVSDDGAVLFPSESKKVTLTARLVRGNESVTKDFELTVKPYKISLDTIESVALCDVSLLEGSYYKELMKTNLDYMMSLNTERLLYNYRRIAGLDTNGVSSYGAWIGSTTGGAGHFEGTYMVALAKASRSIPDYSYNGEYPIERLTYMIGELKKCQDAYAQNHPEDAGYIGAISADAYDALREGRNKDDLGANIWVPWYMCHKNYEAIYGVYMHASNAELKALAYEMMSDFATWCYNDVSPIDETTRLAILRTEYGGMGEVLMNIYKETGDSKHYYASKFFEEKGLLDNIYNGVDVLTGLHANTGIPKFLTCAATYEVTGDEYYKTVCENAFAMIMSRAYANGGSGRDEHWLDNPDKLNTATLSAETCCSYNMLRLADYLYSWTGDKKYLDAYEHIYLNHILASMDPDTGYKMYQTSTKFGYSKIFHTKDNSFWCCTATGVESFVQLSYGVYYEDDDALTVSMFIPSEVKYKGVTIVQSRNLYSEKSALFTVKNDGSFKIRLRDPEWAESAVIKLNGSVLDIKSENGYFVIDREWKNGDTLEYALPFTPRLEKLQGSEKTYALMYGPLLYVVDLGNKNIAEIQANQTDVGSAYTGKIKSTIVTDLENLAEGLTESSENGYIELTFKTENQGDLTFVPMMNLFHKRFGMYLDYSDSENEIGDNNNNNNNNNNNENKDPDITTGNSGSVTTVTPDIPDTPNTGDTPDTGDKVNPSEDKQGISKGGIAAIIASVAGVVVGAALVFVIGKKKK